MHDVDSHKIGVGLALIQHSRRLPWNIFPFAKAKEKQRVFRGKIDASFGRLMAFKQVKVLLLLLV